MNFFLLILLVGHVAAFLHYHDLFTLRKKIGYMKAYNIRSERTNRKPATKSQLKKFFKVFEKRIFLLKRF